MSKKTKTTMTSPELEQFTDAEAECLNKLLAEVIALEKYNRGHWANKKAEHLSLQTHSILQMHKPKVQKTPPRQKRKEPIIPKYDGFEAVLFMAECGFRFLPWDEKEDRPALKWGGENQKNFSNNHNRLRKWQEQDHKRYLYLPGLSGYIGFDIDCGHVDGKDGLTGFYELMRNLAEKSPDRLPSYLRDLPNNFPCFTETPSGGLHLLFKYTGPCKMANIVHDDHRLEIKYLNSCLSLGEKQNGIYVLRGDPLDVPELPPFLIELVNSQPKPRPESHRRVYRLHGKYSLEKILDRVLAISAGNNDTQNKFAWRAAYFGHALEEVLAFVKSRPDDFGNGFDTETVVRHSWHSNKERAVS